ncbi:MAG: MoaD/ThiS family protein [Desulfobacterales bacterium]|nr:MAG: MoaD/ThiS family protein [Desulfobacterales bacterium]
MKITVKVHGTLTKYLSTYDHTTGLVLELPDHSDAAALIEFLGIPKSKVGMVSVNGHQVNSADTIPDKAVVKVFQPIFGG